MIIFMRKPCLAVGETANIVLQATLHPQLISIRKKTENQFRVFMCDSTGVFSFPGEKELTQCAKPGELMMIALISVLNKNPDT